MDTDELQLSDFLTNKLELCEVSVKHPPQEQTLDSEDC